VAGQARDGDVTVGYTATDKGGTLLVVNTLKIETHVLERLVLETHVLETHVLETHVLERLVLETHVVERHMCVGD